MHNVFLLVSLVACLAAHAAPTNDDAWEESTSTWGTRRRSGDEAWVPPTTSPAPAPATATSTTRRRRVTTTTRRRRATAASPTPAPESPTGNCALFPSPTPLKSNFKKPAGGLQVDYKGFTVFLDCTKNAAYRFEYVANNDCGKLERRGSFSLDPNVDKGCQQKNGNAYPTTEGIKFDRGHLVPANHLDSDSLAIYQSNYMTNILPQAANMNRGAWLQSEEIIECLRVTEALYVVGGAVYDKNYPRYNWFKASHNVANPSFFWKVIKAKKLHRETGGYLALWMPNSELAKRDQIDKYVVSLAQLETNLASYGQAQTFNVAASVKRIQPTRAWELPAGCDKQL